MLESTSRGILFRYAIALLLSLFLGARSTDAQTLRGRVVDSHTQEPIIGAVIAVTGSDGSKSATATDVNGVFAVIVKSYPAVLKVSYTGYKVSDIDVYENSNEEIQIDLVESFNAIEGVVIVGYGTQKRSELTGAVTGIGSDNLLTGTAASVNSLLNGAAAGVQVTPTGGQPGAGVSIRIRGGSSVQGGNEPLYVIDGFPIYNDSQSSGVFSTSFDPLSSINPSDIESISVLKDASATAIYGSRGANGVIIITTKRGSKGERAAITYDGNVGFQTLRKKYEVLNGRQFAELRNEALYDGNPSGGHYQYFTEQQLQEIGNGTDWQDLAYHTGLTTSHQIGISGGTEKVRYALSGNYYKQNGILRNTGFERFSGRVNIESQIARRLSIGLNATGSRSQNKQAPESGVFALLQTPATATAYDSDGSYTFENPFNLVLSNPLASILEQTNNSHTNRLLATAFGEYAFIPSLKLKVQVGTDLRNTKDNLYIPASLYEGAQAGGSATVGHNDYYSWLNENTLSYTTDLAKRHHLEVLVGFTQQETNYEITRAGSSNFVTDALTYNNLQGGSVTTTPYSYSGSNSMKSLLSRFNYNYANRHSLSLSLRRDGSSRFGKDRKWGTFPSVGYSWNATEEKFLLPLKRTLSSLKVRLSYGKTGNQEIGDYQSLSTLSAVRYTLNGEQVVGFAPDRIANNDLGWETTWQFDAGIDLGLWKDRLTLSLDYYRKKTSDLLLEVAIPYTTGYSTSLQNYGSVVNQGLEASVQAAIITGKLKWDFSGNISLNRNKVTGLGSNVSSGYITTSLFGFGGYIIEEGKPLGSFYGAVYDGVLQSGEESTKGSYTYNQSAIAGDRLYKDLNGDGKFTNAEDRTIIGNAEPDFIFGVTNKISYRNFDLSFLITGSVGNDIANINKVRLSLFTGNQNAIAAAADRWTATNPSTYISRAKYSDPAAVFSSEFIEDGSYARLKNITLGYTFGKSFLNIFGINGLRLYFTATNLWTLTHYSGYDPEVTSADNAITAGTDYGAYPTARTFVFGVQIKF